MSRDAQGSSAAGQHESKEQATRNYRVDTQRATVVRSDRHRDTDTQDARTSYQLVFGHSKCIRKLLSYTKRADAGMRSQAQQAWVPLGGAEGSRKQREKQSRVKPSASMAPVAPGPRPRRHWALAGAAPSNPLSRSPMRPLSWPSPHRSRLAAPAGQVVRSVLTVTRVFICGTIFSWMRRVPGRRPQTGSSGPANEGRGRPSPRPGGKRHAGDLGNNPPRPAPSRNLALVDV